MIPLVLTHARPWSNVALKFVPDPVRTVSSACRLHAIAELLTEAIDLPVVGPHAFPHDARGDADHVGVSDPPALDDADDRHPGDELAFHGLDAQDASIRTLAGHRALRLAPLGSAWPQPPR